jgi:hypothetical protein
MNNNLKITCPKCKATFDAGDAFNAHFENAQIENEKKLSSEMTKRTAYGVQNKNYRKTKCRLKNTIHSM